MSKECPSNISKSDKKYYTTTRSKYNASRDFTVSRSLDVNLASRGRDKRIVISKNVPKIWLNKQQNKKNEDEWANGWY